MYQCDYPGVDKSDLILQVHNMSTADVQHYGDHSPSTLRNNCICSKWNVHIQLHLLSPNLTISVETNEISNFYVAYFTTTAEFLYY